MEMLCIVKKVLVMTVNSGNAGQMYILYVGKKITKLLSQGGNALQIILERGL